MSECIDLREYGRLEQEVKQLTDKMEKVEEQLAQIVGILEQAKGGWRTMMAVGGFAATLSSGITWLFSHWEFK